MDDVPRCCLAVGRQGLRAAAWFSVGVASGGWVLVSVVVVAGLGYMGLPLAMRAVAAGH